MSDLGDLIAAGLGEQPATIPVDLYARALAEIRTARAEIERLYAIAAIADKVRAYRDGFEQGRQAAEAAARAEIERLRRAPAYGTKLCPRCGEALAAEVAAENGGNP